MEGIPSTISLLSLCTLWLQANMIHLQSFDVSMIIQFVCDLYRRGIRVPTMQNLSNSKNDRFSSIATSIAPYASKIQHQERKLLKIVLRHLAISIGKDREWTISALNAIVPLKTCIDVVLSLETIKLPTWLETHRKSILESCGGIQYLLRQRQFVAALLTPKILLELSQEDQNILKSLQLDTIPKESSHVASPFSLFVPIFNHDYHLFPRFNGNATRVQLYHARVVYHPIMPLLIASDSCTDTVEGFAVTHPFLPWLRLKTEELRLHLGVISYQDASLCHSYLPTCTADLPSQLMVHMAKPSTSYPHISITSHLPIDNGNIPYLVECQRGNIPVVLSVPHGGSLAGRHFGMWQKQHLHPRKPTQTSRKRFTMLSDARTVHVGSETCNALDTSTGGFRPYIVIAKFHRKFVDVNRAIHDDAYTPKSVASRMYAHYHSTLVNVLQEIWLRFPMHDPLLLDIHGQKAKTCTSLNISNQESKEMIYIGTRNGKTIQKSTSMREFFVDMNTALKYKGWRGIYPPPQDDLAVVDERPEFLGGYIVHSYGINRSNVNAIQLELGTCLRGVESDDLENGCQQRQRTASALAIALEKHLNRNGFHSSKL